MSLAEDLQIIALREVLADTNEYRLRWLFRWYSKTFSTPLSSVKEIPLTDILQAFWETTYEAMEPEAIEDERQRLLETAEQRRDRILREDAERSEADRFAEEIEAQAKRAPQKIEDLQVKEPQVVKTREKIKEIELPDPKKPPVMPTELPENVSIKFMPTNFFDELADKLDGLEIPDDDPQSSR